MVGFAIPTDTKTWLSGIAAAIIGGGATAGMAWMGMGAAKVSGLDIPVLNWKALGIIMLTGSLTNLLAYLKQSPIPVKTTTITLTKEETK
jgi:deoxyxylulose-5-phosphate synthase